MILCREVLHLPKSANGDTAPLGEADYLFQDPNPYDFFVVGALMNVSDFETVLVLFASSHGFLVATAAPPPPDDEGDDFLFHEPMPYPARAEDDRRGC